MKLHDEARNEHSLGVYSSSPLKIIIWLNFPSWLELLKCSSPYPNSGTDHSKQFAAESVQCNGGAVAYRSHNTFDNFWN